MRLFGGSAIEGDPGSPHIPPASLDTVFLWDDGLFTAAAARPGAGSREAQRSVLEDCHDLLEPGGHVVVAATNRFSLAALAGRREEPDGLPFIGLLPRLAADLCSRLLRGLPYRRRTRGRRGYVRLLGEAGFEPPAVHTAWPKLRAWRAVVHDPSRRSQTDYRLPADGRRAALAATLLRWLHPLGLDLTFQPAFILVARKTGEDPAVEPTRSLVGRILRSEDLEIPPAFTLRYRSFKLHFATGGRYFRLPLTARALRGQRREADALRRLESHPVGRFIPRSSRVRQVEGAEFSVADDLSHEAGPDEETRLNRLERAFDVMFVEASTMALKDTATWKRVFSAENREAFGSLGCAEPMRRIETATARRRVPVGPVHGDLHPGNVLESEGRIVIIDWDRFEEPGPHFLDALHGLYAHVRRDSLKPARGSSDETDLCTVRLLLDRNPRVPLLERVDATLGEATWAEAVCVYRLSWLSRQLGLGTPEPESSGWHETGARYRAHLSLCTSRLKAGNPE